MTNEQKAIELLKTRIDTMEVHLMQNGFGFYSPEDLEDFIEACKFLNHMLHTKYDTLHVRQYLETL